jgi:putative membrane protein
LLALAVAAASAQAQTTPAMPAHAGAEHAGMLTQAQALGVLSAIDQSEVAAGQLAQKKVAAGPVRDYAARMVKEHSENEAKLSAWSPDRNAAPAKAQMAKGKQELATLQPLQEDAFRTAYVKAMVKGHTEALDALDHKLIPAAKDAQVKAFLQETRTHVASHLAAAKALQGDDAAAVPHQDGPTGAH